MSSSAQMLRNADSSTVSEEIDSSFNSGEWLSYFRTNKSIRTIVNLPDEIALDLDLKKCLIKSLQKFQIGETGDGRHLKKYARRLGDEAYNECVDLFIREEQGHGRILAEVIRALDGTLLTWHWTDLVFIFLRRILGLKTEVFILLIAEVVGKCFYKCIADKIEDRNLREVFALIVLDEIAHLQFHSQFLSMQMSNKTWLMKFIVHYVWMQIFFAALFVFIADHRKSLDALSVSSAEFVERCSREFHRSASTVFK